MLLYVWLLKLSPALPTQFRAGHKLLTASFTAILDRFSCTAAIDHVHLTLSSFLGEHAVVFLLGLH